MHYELCIDICMAGTACQSQQRSRGTFGWHLLGFPAPHINLCGRRQLTAAVPPRYLRRVAGDPINGGRGPMSWMPSRQRSRHATEPRRELHPFLVSKSISSLPRSSHRGPRVCFPATLPFAGACCKSAGNNGIASWWLRFPFPRFPSAQTNYKPTCRHLSLRNENLGLAP